MDDAMEIHHRTSSGSGFLLWPSVWFLLYVLVNKLLVRTKLKYYVKFFNVLNQAISIHVATVNITDLKQNVVFWDPLALLYSLSVSIAALSYAQSVLRPFAMIMWNDDLFEDQNDRSKKRTTSGSILFCP